jgi:hypothetical protein
MADLQELQATGRVLCGVCRLVLGVEPHPRPAEFLPSPRPPCPRCGASFPIPEILGSHPRPPWRWYADAAALEHVGLMHYGAVEIRGADELPPGPYWAIDCHDAWGWRQWLHLQKERPTVGGRAIVRWEEHSSLPMPWPGVTADTYRCRVWGVLVIQRNRKVRKPYARDRLAVGDLAVAP